MAEQYLIKDLEEKFKDQNVPVISESFIFTDTLSVLNGQITFSQPRTKRLIEMAAWDLKTNNTIGDIILIGPHHFAGVIAVVKALTSKQ